MQSQEKIRRHAGLVDTMAQTLGLDLEEAMLRGVLGTGQIEDAVLSCTNCSQPDACQRWTGQQQGTAAATPDYCRNADLFRSLQDRM